MLVELHDTASRALASLKRDVHPETSEEAYVPHLSLTSGLPAQDASRLGEAAKASRLNVDFTVGNISLLGVGMGSGGKEYMRCARSFTLSRQEI